MKPKIYAYDYLGRRYADLSNIADITIAHEIPQSLKGYEGVILHSEFPSNLKYLVDEIKKKYMCFFTQCMKNHPKKQEKILYLQRYIQNYVQ